LEIGDIASKDDVTIGRNLAIRSAISPYDGAKMTESEYHYTFSGDTSGAGACLSGSIFELNKKYVVSFKINVNNANQAALAGHCDCYTINKITIDGTEVKPDEGTLRVWY
jgi:hypothetical protein